MIKAFRLNCHRAAAWYVRAYNALPDCVRLWYCESARVQYDCTTYVKFGLKSRRVMGARHAK